METRTPPVAQREPSPVAEESIRAEAPPRRRFGGLRARIMTWSILSLAVAIAAAVLVVRQSSLVQLDNRIDDALEQEADELRRLSAGRDPLTGERFGSDARRILEVFLDRNVPAPNEAYYAFIDGRLFTQRPNGSAGARLGEDEATMRQWSGLTSSRRGAVETADGTAEYLAIPLRSAGETQGVFVTVVFRDLEAEHVASAVTGAVEVGLIVLLLGSAIAWAISESVLRPVRAVTATARRITSADLSDRLVATGRDELAELAATFNDMLEKLEEAFDTQRRFVDDAGHELRTPITVIQGHLDLMGDEPEERRTTLALVDDELERMRRIVQDLLTLARSERPDFLTFEPVGLAALTETSFAKAQALGERDWRLGPVGQGIVIGDRQRVTQAVMQLAQNAKQHTQEGEQIEIGSRLSGTSAELWVRDAGEGIAPEEIRRVFDRFARGQHPRASDGAGLGLSIVRAIAQAHHGDVVVSSESGVGSVFTIVWPADQPFKDGDGP